MELNIEVSENSDIQWLLRKYRDFRESEGGESPEEEQCRQLLGHTSQDTEATSS